MMLENATKPLITAEELTQTLVDFFKA